LELTEEKRVAIAQEFNPPIDMTEVGVKLALRSDADVSPLVQVFDGDGDRIDFKTIVRGRLPFQWFNFGITTIDGEPDLSAIEELRIAASVGEDQRARVWCDELHFVPRPKPGKILIHFDDTNVTDYSRAFPVFEEYGFVGATFANSEFVGDEGKLTLEQLSELQNAGWDICNHTTEHQDLPKTPESEREAAIRDGKQWLVDHGFEPGAEYFAYPKSAYDEDVLSVVDQYQRLAFVGGLPCNGRISNKLLIHRAAGEPTAAEAEYLIDLTAKYGGITGLLYHNITDEFEPGFEQTMSYLHEQASNGAVDVVPVREFDPEI
jgi:hypothetical protein